MQLHHLKRPRTRRFKKVIGRGGKRGTTSGRGTKGQKARAGHRMRPEFRDAIKKLPKKRGHSFFGPAKSKLPTVKLGAINQAFAANGLVNPQTLGRLGLVRLAKKKVPTQVKVLGEGTIDRPLTFERLAVTASARVKIEAIGGVIKNE